MAKHLVGKFLVDDHDLGVEIGGDSSQSRAVLGRLDLEIGISEERGHGAQHHRADKSAHRGDALGHDDDHAVASGHAVLPEYCCLHPRTMAKVAKRQRFPLVFVNPGSHKRTARRSRVESFDEIAEANQTLIVCDEAGCSCNWRRGPLFWFAVWRGIA